MTDTPNLALPYILAAQAQKHVTHNEALRALDCIVQLSVLSRALMSPPVSPASGSRYIVATSATGEWAGRDDMIAAYQDGAWAYFIPRVGWLAWVAGENVLVIYAAGTWSELPGGGGSGGVTDHGLLSGLADDDHPQYHTDIRGDARYLPLVPDEIGINTTADSTNRLALKSPASLFDNDGAGHQQKINKTAVGDTASQLYQTSYSGRAEIGLTGDDDFHFKVSPNGSTWKDAIKIDKTSGLVTRPYTPAVTVQKMTSSGTWSKPVGCTAVRVTVIGAGGSGGGALGGSSLSSAGSGGGGGGTSIKWLDVTGISSVAVTVGAGGVGNSGAAGNAGGTSSFGTHAQATGGGGGVMNAASAAAVVLLAAPANGLGSLGDINFAGLNGSIVYRTSGASIVSGTGGTSSLLSNQGARGSQGNGAGANSPGCGGSGAVSYDATPQMGGNGANGIVIVEEFY